jgi:protein-disulfide isomerase
MLLKNCLIVFIQKGFLFMRKKALWAGFAVMVMFFAALVVYLTVFAPKEFYTGFDTVPRGVDSNNNPWIGAKSPKLVINEYLDYNCPHCIAAHKRLRRAVIDKIDKIRIVRHDYARSHCSTADKDMITDVLPCDLVRSAICASKKIDFWKWNDAIIKSPRNSSKTEYLDYLPEKIKQFGFDPDWFNKCIRSDATSKQAEAIYVETKKAGVHATPTYIVNGKKIKFSDLLQKIRDL